MEKTREFLLFLVRYYNISKIKLVKDGKRYKEEQCFIDLSHDSENIFKSLYVWSCFDDEMFKSTDNKSLDYCLTCVKNKNVRDLILNYYKNKGCGGGDISDDIFSYLIKNLKIPNMRHFLYNNCNSSKNHTIRLDRTNDDMIHIGFSLRCKEKNKESEKFVNKVIEIVKSRYRNRPMDIDQKITNDLKEIMKHSIDEDDLNDSYMYILDDYELDDASSNMIDDNNE